MKNRFRKMNRVTTPLGNASTNDIPSDALLLEYIRELLPEREMERVRVYLAQSPQEQERYQRLQRENQHFVQTLQSGLSQYQPTTQTNYNTIAPRLRRNRFLSFTNDGLWGNFSFVVAAAAILVAVLLLSNLRPDVVPDDSGVADVSNSATPLAELIQDDSNVRASVSPDGYQQSEALIVVTTTPAPNAIAMENSVPAVEIQRDIASSSDVEAAQDDVDTEEIEEVAAADDDEAEDEAISAEISDSVGAPDGPSGGDGAMGPAGLAGVASADGAIGPAGAPGPAGPVGSADSDRCWDTNGNGIPDVSEDGNGDGSVNSFDCFGPAGPAGIASTDSAMGPAGADGAMGPAGLAGPAGAAGRDGAPDVAGPAGARGERGAAGAQGPAGAAVGIGPAGPAGAAGAQGPAGRCKR